GAQRWGISRTMVRNWISRCLASVLAAGGLLILAAVARAQTCGDRVVEADEQCDDGNTVGGDGCASNCTLEDAHTCQFAQGSKLIEQVQTFQVLYPVRGIQRVFTGRARTSDPSRLIPITIRADGLTFTSIRVDNSCACLVPLPGPESPPDVVAEGM